MKQVWAPVCALIACSLAAGEPKPKAPEKADPLDTLVEKIQKDAAKTTEDEMKQLFELSKQTGRAFTAAPAVKSYLKAHLTPPAPILYGAAENAELAGDFRTAVSRYKAYLAAPNHNEEAVNAATRMYSLLIDFLRSEEEAYQFMKTAEDGLRNGQFARKFDIWFLNQARARKDMLAAAKRLAKVYADKLPLEKERMHYWEYTDWLFTEMMRGEAGCFEAGTHLRPIVPLVRESPERQLRFTFILDHLAFMSQAAGKNKEALKGAFTPVLASAKAYFDQQPSAQRLQDIFWSFFGGHGRIEGSVWNHNTDLKQEFFAAAFDKLSDADKVAMMGWHYNHTQTAEGWAALGAKYPQIFKTASITRQIPFVRSSNNIEVYKKQATFLAGVPSYDAGVINSVAAGPDLEGAIAHYLKNEAWHRDAPGQIFQQVRGEIWPAFHGMAQAANKPLPGDYFEKLLVKVGPELVVKSPVAIFDPGAVGEYLRCCFLHSGADANDRSKMADILRTLDWAPYSKDERNKAFGPAHEAFKRWAEEARKAAGDDKAKKDAINAQITPLEKAFHQSLVDSPGDAAKAPTPLCAKMVQWVQAVRKKNREAYAAVSREVYALVKDYHATKPVLGKWLMRVLIDNREGLDNLDFQCEVLADQLTQADQPAAQERIVDIMQFVTNNRPGWQRHNHEWFDIPGNEKGKARKLNEVFTKALMAQLEKGTYWPYLLTQFRATRRGNGWTDFEQDAEVFDKLLTSKAFSKVPFRPDWWIKTNTVAYMWLLRGEFGKLAQKYQIENYFDDMYVEEVTASKMLDWGYFNYGHDQKKKVSNLAATMFKDLAKLPLGYNDQPQVCLVNHFWDWHNRILEADPAVRDAAISAIEATYGKTRFDSYAMGNAYFSHQANGATPETRKEFFERLKIFRDRIKESADRISLPPMHGLTRMGEPKNIKKEELDLLVSLFPECTPWRYPGGWNLEHLAVVVAEGLAAQKRFVELGAVMPHLWKICYDTRNTGTQKQLFELTRRMQDEKNLDVAAVMASVGLDIVQEVLVEDVRSGLTSIRNRTARGVIPVAAGDPKYNVYLAQYELQSGKSQNAWALYQERRDLVPSMMKDLDVGFLLWILDRNTDSGSYDAAETLAKAMLQWFDATPGGFEAESRARLMLCYANISFARTEYARAKVNYERITAAKEFDGTQAKRDAFLKIAEVSFKMKDYDGALKQLEELTRKKDVYLETEANYLIGLVKFTQDELDGAARALELVFNRDPNHVRAVLLQKNLHVKRKNFIGAILKGVGDISTQKILVPGTPLQVTLEDKILAYVGSATNVEIRAWTKSGDEEKFNLLQSGDSKTTFQGSVNTGMGPPVKNDRVLQVLGDDEVNYDYSDEFIKNYNIKQHQPGVLSISSNSELKVSSGKILSKEEEDDLELERQIKLSMRLNEGMDEKTALSTMRANNQVKPGNKINVRVADFDRNVSEKADTIPIKVSTSSGDIIKAFDLTETGTHTGIFEAAIPTTMGQATATGSTSAEGREPNNVISAGDRPFWMAQTDNVRPKFFMVNLNDNVSLGRMNVLADVPDRKLKAFQVETSMNGTDFNVIGSYPEAVKPWDGALRVEMVKCPSFGRDVNDAVRYMSSGYVTTKVPKLIFTVPAFALHFPDNGLLGNADKLKLEWDGPQAYYLLHIHGAFYQAKKEFRTFKLDHKNKGLDQSRYFMTLDGTADQTPYEIKRTLAKGVHRLDVYLWARRHSGSQFEVLCDVEGAETMAQCKADMFDPVKQPEIKSAVWIDPAEIKANPEGTSFEITFAKGAQARVVRLSLADFEKDAPAINKIKLDNTQGQAVLPTKQDYLQLRENQNLEILPGDKIHVVYEDPKVVSDDRKLHEAFMSSTFFNAELSACFVEFEKNQRGNRTPRYIPMRRFKPGDNIHVFINDPDNDVSEQQDKVKFSAVSGGSKIELEATETEPHSGVFLGNVFPVLNEPARPNELKVTKEDDVTFHYLDQENTDPGIPWDRTFLVEQSYHQTPVLTVFDVTSRALTPEEIRQNQASMEVTRQVTEKIPVIADLIVQRGGKPQADKPAQVMIDGPVIVELTYPAIAQSPRSIATIYVQAQSARDKVGKGNDGSFDINVPGTLKISRQPDGLGRIEIPAGYRRVLFANQRGSSDLLSEGRFMFMINLELGEVPKESLITYEPPRDQQVKPLPLTIRGNDTIYVGFEYNDDAGAARWVVQKAVLNSDINFHVMNSRYQEELEAAHVGDNLYLRVIQKTLDSTDERDLASVDVTSKGGKKTKINLAETYGHSGIFKGTLKLSYVGDKDAAAEPGTLAVDYGDEVTVTFPTKEPLTRTVPIFKGSNGVSTPFTRRFKDPSLAVQTQFRIAEAYFELAKRHRELKQDDLAREEIATGKRLLEEAIRDYPYTESKIQADYLLADLSLELANETTVEEQKKKHYVEAVARFSDIVTSYPDNAYAPKSQYKKALVYEKMGEIEKACEEYVKLSYRYPDHELVADTIARLGDYFRKKAVAFDKDAKAQMEPVQAEKLKRQAKEMFITSGQVFGRLAPRFPSHPLAYKAAVLSGQCYQEALDFERAIRQYKTVIDSPDADKDLIAQAMYWTAHCHMTRNNDVDAYRMFKRLMWDYPASQWAKHARGIMVEDRMLRIEQQEAKGDQ